MAHDTRYDKNSSLSQSHRRRADTHIKASGSLASTHIPTKAVDVNQMVLDELQYNTGIADTDAFINALLDVDKKIVSDIYDKLVEAKKYDTVNERWAGFPLESEGTESALYHPFVIAANAINEACAVVSPPLATRIHSSWLDRHSISPSSRDSDAPAIRPDVISVIGARTDMEVMDERIRAEEKAKAEASVDGTQVRHILASDTTCVSSCS